MHMRMHMHVDVEPHLHENYLKKVSRRYSRPLAPGNPGCRAQVPRPVLTLERTFFEDHVAGLIGWNASPGGALGSVSHHSLP